MQLNNTVKFNYTKESDTTSQDSKSTKFTSIDALLFIIIPSIVALLLLIYIVQKLRKMYLERQDEDELK